MKNKALKRVLAILLCVALLFGSRLSGITDIIQDLHANELEEEDSEAVVAENVEEVELDQPEEESEEPDGSEEPSPEEETAQTETPEAETAESPEATEGTEPGQEDGAAEGTDLAAPADAEVPEESQDGEETKPEGEETDPSAENPDSVTEGELAAAEENGLLETKPEEKVAATATEKAEPVLEVNYEDDQITVTVKAEKEGIIPEGTVLSVTPIEKKEVTGDMEAEEKAKVEEVNAQYDLTEQKLAEESEKREDDIVGFLAYNICLEDKDGNKTEPNGEVKVTLDYKEAVIPEEVETADVKNVNVTVMHLAENEDGEVQEAVDMANDDKLEDIQTTDNQEVETTEFVTDSSDIYALAWTGEIDPLTGEFTYENDDVIINVSAVGENAIPEGTKLQVIPILAEAETADQYQQVAEELAKKAEGETYDIAGFLAYDISLIDKDGNKQEPNGEVKVTMDYKKDIIPEEVKELPSETENPEIGEASEITEEAVSEEVEETAEDTETAPGSGTIVIPLGDGEDQAEEEAGINVTVMHLEEDEAGTVAQVVDMAETDKAIAVNTTEKQEVRKVEFTTESFSIFTITWKNNDDSTVQTLKIKIVDTSGRELTVPQTLTNSLTATLYSGDTFKISEIYNARGEYKDIAEFISNGKTYKFIRATNIWGNTVDMTAQTDVDELKLENGNVRWRHKNSTNWGMYDKRDTFYFMYGEPYPTITTVDNGNIIMRMIDHTGTAATAAQGGRGANGLMGDLGVGGLTTGLVDNTLDDNHYPKLTDSNGGTNLAELFDEDHGEPVNRLFTLDNKGYYEYDSSKNYAHLKENGDFEVYSQIGTPRYEGDNNDKAYSRGNFFPYNDIVQGYNSKNSDSSGKTLALTVGEPDYYFGMYMEASFAQPEGGKVNVTESNPKGDSMIYEFAGDDDLWIFIDDVLVLDMGGLRFMEQGTINFADGSVTVSGKNVGTIKDMYWAAHKFPDGNNWTDFNDPNVKKHFTEEGAFTDYSTHVMKMFYMERGAGASNLHMKMNLQTIPKDSVSVTKQLKDSDPKYADMLFPFELWAQEPDPSREGQYLDIYQVVTAKPTVTVKTANGETKTLPDNEVSFNPNTGIFMLKPGQTATFEDLPRNRKYFVKELNVDLSRYENVEVNKASYTGYDRDNPDNEIDRGASQPVDGKLTLTTTQQSVAERWSVVFTNDCSDGNSKPLFVKKVMGDTVAEEGTPVTDAFDVKIWMEETESGQLQPYTGEYYLIGYKGQEKHYYQYQIPDGGTEAVLTDLGTETPKKENCDKAEDGMVKIPAGYMVETNQVIEGTAFAVQEMGLDDTLYEAPEIVVTEGDRTVDPSVANGDIQSIGQTEFGVGATVQVTNTPIVQYTWEIIKRSSSSDEVAPLDGARFALTSVPAEGGTPVTYIGVSAEETGKIEWSRQTISEGDEESTLIPVPADSIPKGTYELRETAAPTGYALSGDVWTITLDNSGIVITRPSAIPGGTPETINASDSSKQDENGKTIYEYSFYNAVLYELPETGGIGIHWYIVSGTLMMMAGILILYKRKYAGRC